MPTDEQSFESSRTRSRQPMTALSGSLWLPMAPWRLQQVQDENRIENAINSAGTVSTFCLGACSRMQSHIALRGRVRGSWSRCKGCDGKQYKCQLPGGRPDSPETFKTPKKARTDPAFR